MVKVRQFGDQIKRSLVIKMPENVYLCNFNV